MNAEEARKLMTESNIEKTDVGKIIYKEIKESAKLQKNHCEVEICAADIDEEGVQNIVLHLRSQGYSAKYEFLEGTEWDLYSDWNIVISWGENKSMNEPLKIERPKPKPFSFRDLFRKQ